MATVVEAYRDAGLPVNERVSDLLARMTVDEKIAQLGSVWSFELFRTEDTSGEAPYLATELGVAFTRGIQGPDLGTGVAATAKHLVGHGLAEGGLNQAPAHAGWRELRDEQLLPFEAAVRTAGLAAVMPAHPQGDRPPHPPTHQLPPTIPPDARGLARG